MSKQKVNDIHAALMSFGAEGDHKLPVFMTPEERQARIRELSIRHLASMPREDFASIVQAVEAERASARAGQAAPAGGIQ